MIREHRLKVAPEYWEPLLATYARLIAVEDHHACKQENDELRVKLEIIEKERSNARKAAIHLAKKLSWANRKAALFPEMLDALRPFAAIEIAWMKDGVRREIRMDWLTAAREVIAEAEALERGTE